MCVGACGLCYLRWCQLFLEYFFGGKHSDWGKLVRALQYFVLVAVAVATATSGAIGESCSLQQMAALDMQGDASEGVVVDVTINGEPHKFLVDTGGVYSEISQDLAEKLGLRKNEISAEIYTVSGARLKYGVTVKSLMLGSLVAPNAHLLVNPEYDGLDGIIGPDILQVFDVDFDFAHKRLNLFSPDHCEGKVVYWAKSYSDAEFKLGDGYHIQFVTNLDGHSLRSILDTGSRLTWLSMKYAAQMFSLDETSPGVERTDMNFGGKSLYRKAFQSLTLSGIAVENPVIYLRPDLDAQSFSREHSEKEASDPIYGDTLDSPPLIFGMNVLSKLHLYVAYKEHKLYFTDANAH